MKRIILTICILVVIIAGAHAFFKDRINTWLSGDDQIVCTADAKICPDGSAVGRVAPLCEFAACPAIPSLPTVTATSTQVSLGLGQKGKIGNVEVVFNSFLQDSRCPIDVTCIQAGSVSVNITISSGTATETRNMSSNEAPYNFHGYNISIVNVSPVPKSAMQITPLDYRITFQVVK